MSNITNIIKMVECNLKNCSNEYKEVISRKIKVMDECKIIIDDYKEKKLTKKEFIDKVMVIRKKHINSDIFSKFLTCGFKHCYDIHKQILDAILSYLLIINIKYKKPIKYTVKDYKKIILLFVLHKEIMPIANSQ